MKSYIPCIIVFNVKISQDGEIKLIIFKWVKYEIVESEKLRQGTPSLFIRLQICTHVLTIAVGNYALPSIPANILIWWI